MSVARTIESKLTEALSPQFIRVTDESHRHAGHAGARPEGESHFEVTVVSAAFTGRSQVERQRMVYDLLAPELAGPVHALRLSTRAPDEADRPRTRHCG